jgi:uncharacterized DUF497 family protein
VEFEFDRAKSQAKKAKHGIDFEEAKALWDAEKFVEADAKSPVGERRTFRIAPIDAVLWFCVFTMREEKIRLISVRHVRPQEKELYEQN